MKNFKKTFLTLLCAAVVTVAVAGSFMAGRMYEARNDYAAMSDMFTAGRMYEARNAEAAKAAKAAEAARARYCPRCITGESLGVAPSMSTEHPTLSHLKNR